VPDVVGNQLPPFNIQVKDDGFFGHPGNVREPAAVDEPDKAKGAAAGESSQRQRPQ